MQSRVLTVPSRPRPFVGLPAGAPGGAVTLVGEQGCIVETGAVAEECATYLDATAVATLATPTDWLAAMEASPGARLPRAPWASGARSALCVSGDLDALSLLEYASRLWVR